MRLSTRNQFTGTVVSITEGEAIAVVKVRLSGDQTITSSITREAAAELGLAEGSSVTALVKSSDVALAVE